MESNALIVIVKKSQNEVVTTQTNIANATRVAIARVNSIGIVRKADGSIDYFVSLVQDITERVHTLEALRKSEEHFRRYFELGLVGMAITSIDRNWVEFNDTLCGMLGYQWQYFYSRWRRYLC
jgi:PAS domain-containing protein